MDRAIRAAGGAGSLEPHGEHTSSGSVASGTVVSVIATTASMGASDEDAADTSAIVAMAALRRLGTTKQVGKFQAQASTVTATGHKEIVKQICKET